MLAAGVDSVILRRFDAESVLAAIEQHRVESSVMVPTHFIRLLALSPDVRAKYDVSSLRYVVHTGAACPVDVKQAMLEWWGPVLWEAYGATEVGTTCAIGPEDWLAHPGSVGQAVPPFEALILDDDGRELPRGTEGRLCFKDSTGRGVVYHNDPEKSAAAYVAPGIFTLGEIGYIDDDGFVYITDRFSDLVVSGGVNIYPAESEQVLITHPKVADVACIGVPHPEMGEQLKALVIPVDPEDPPGEDELLGYVRQRLSHYKCPRSVQIVATLDRNTMGKVNKRSLRAPWWQHAAATPKERTT
jgi:long-chain acyl-CoA synthetase